MRDLMIDIETLSSASDAVMIQLGACFFDRYSGVISSEFVVNIDRRSCEDLGFKVDQSTIDWWATQDQAIFQKIMTENVVTAEVALRRFLSFIGNIKDIVTWSHATFDFVIVQNYLKRLNLGYLPFKGARDIRTLTDLSGINLSSYDWTNKTHNALDDCRFQVKYCVDAINMINNKGD